MDGKSLSGMFGRFVRRHEGSRFGKWLFRLYRKLGKRFRKRLDGTPGSMVADMALIPVWKLLAGAFRHRATRFPVPDDFLGEDMVRWFRFKRNRDYYVFEAVNRLTKAIDGMAYRQSILMNYYTDIAKGAPAHGALRRRQEGNVLLLKRLMEVAGDVPFWLAYGSLLGAVRHGGFIPWDDDFDFCMMEGDLPLLQAAIDGSPDMEIRANPLLDEFDELRNSVYCIRWKAGGDARIDVILWHDVAPDERGNRRIESRLWSYDCTYDGEPFPYDLVFPLGTMQFAGVAVPCPRDYEMYLQNTYGDFMRFPSGGTMHVPIREKPTYEELLRRLEGVRQGQASVS